MIKPEVGSLVDVRDVWEQWHTCTVTELLDTQFMATYEVARKDGGWNERVLWGFFRDHGTTWKVRGDCRIN